MENDPQAIRQEIEATRERLADTAEAIAYKADVPARVKENVASRVEAVKDTVSDIAANVTSTLTGVTLQTRDNVQDLTDNAKSTLSGASGTAKDNVSGLTQSAKSTLSDAKDAASDFVARTRDNVPMPSAETTRALASNAGTYVAQNPLGLVLGSIAVGFLVGLALPVSDVERDNVGPIGERVAEQAKSAASDIAQQGKAAVAQVVSDAFTRGTSSSS